MLGCPSEEQTVSGRTDMKGSQQTLKPSIDYCTLELSKKDFLHLGEIFGPEVSSFLALRFSDSPEIFSSNLYMEVPSIKTMTCDRGATRSLLSSL